MLIWYEINFMLVWVHIYLLQKWLVGDDSETPILNSAESTEICPNNASSWSYVDGTQVCFLNYELYYTTFLI